MRQLSTAPSSERKLSTAVAFVKYYSGDGLEKDRHMAENYSFSIILEPQEGGGFTVLVPALPEVITEGDSEHEALANAEEAMRAILEYRRDNGMPIPPDADPQIRCITLAA
jgi:antitoxin HicB